MIFAPEGENGVPERGLIIPDDTMSVMSVTRGRQRLIYDVGK